MNTVQDVITDTNSRMQRSVESLNRELNTVRTGRASSSLVESLLVDYYSVPTPLGQIANITVPEARSLLIQPWDKQSLKEVERTILTSDLGLVPNNDGTQIRINIPVLTEERRKELVKIVGQKVEGGLISLRNIRRDSLETFRKMEKEKTISQDEGRRAQAELQSLTDEFSSAMTDIKSQKESEVMQV